MKKANYIISIIICAIAIVFLVIGKSYTFTLDGITTASSWPNILCWILLLLGIVLFFWNTFSKNIPASKIDFRSEEFSKVLITIAMVFGLLVLYYYLGCLISLAIFFPVFLLFLGERNWKTIVIYDVVAVGMIYVVFELILDSRIARPFFM